MFTNLTRTLSDQNRQVNIDFLRGCAVLAVVLYHFGGLLPYGNLGVDLFFVISGYLVGGSLMKDFFLGRKIRFFGFVLRRGFKIWPSYYIFLVIGFILSNLLFAGSLETERLHFSELPRYLFWYRNFTGFPMHFSFDHVWSLCIEEHFYVLLPALILFLRVFRANSKVFVLSLVATILLAFTSKCLMLNFANSKDTFSMTFNRLDTFSWGILIAYLQFRGKDLALNPGLRNLLLLIGVSGIALTIFLNESGAIPYFKALIMHSVLPIWMFCIIWSTLTMKSQRWLTPFRIIGYYSYNWYLWNPIVAVSCIHFLGITIFSFFTYLVVSFLLAVIFTRLVEENFLTLRNKIIRK